MYSVVIVDDDQWALADIRASFDFERYGFELIAECTSAEEALPIILRENPNLVVTDICMDTVNGLDMIRKVRESRRDMLFVILSGHENFDFAREAVELDVFRYMLKPINRTDAQQTMQQASRHLLEINARLIEREDVFVRITSYVEAHLEGKLTQNDVAREFFLSRGYISEMFRKRLGMTFVEYKEKLRITRAKELLAQTDLLIGDIAMRVGYDDMCYFARVFKKNYSMTPQQYRASVIKISAQLERKHRGEHEK